ncbi:unnamed protein product [Durusdinium trenchii]|uniref:Sulfotransferase n=1 Tax=Durusdinium trenchii TaxID=1381693 RepID=A0ABP0MEK4_9DINO
MSLSAKMITTCLAAVLIVILAFATLTRKDVLCVAVQWQDKQKPAAVQTQKHDEKTAVQRQERDEKPTAVQPQERDKKEKDEKPTAVQSQEKDEKPSALQSQEKDEKPTAVQSQEKDEKTVAKQSGCLFPLVVHIGPHKTGTTTFQTFLIKNAEWLWKEYGISVAANEGVKAAAYIPSTIRQQHGLQHNPKFADPKKMQELFQTIGTMPANSPVILSSEEFSTLGTAEWNDFKSQIAIQKRCVSIVVVHRRGLNLRASIWNEVNKNSISPDSFLISLLRRNGGEEEFQLKVLDTVRSIADSVEGVSYEYLREANYSIASFTVCNATLRLEGSKWELCKTSVELRMPGIQNPSAPPAAFDVVRLAYGLYTRQKAANYPRCRKKFAVRAYKNSAVLRVAEQMPTLCGSLNEAFSHVDELWYNRTGALKPEGADDENENQSDQRLGTFGHLQHPDVSFGVKSWSTDEDASRCPVNARRIRRTAAERA